MAARAFRFSVGIHSAKSRAALQDKARRLEDLGFDALHLPDHLGAPAPFPVLTAIAAATSTVRLGTYVLNAGFYKPALLARDAAEVDQLSDGRLDLGLGAGYVRRGVRGRRAAIPERPATCRLPRARHHLSQEAPARRADPDRRQRKSTADGGRPARRHHRADRRQSGAVADPLAERIEFVRSAAGDRFADLELNLAITAVPSDNSGKPDLSLTRRFVPDLSDEELLALPAVLSGSPRDIADTLRGYRETTG